MKTPIDLPDNEPGSPVAVRGRVKLPIVECAYEARPGEEMTPERVADVLLQEEACREMGADECRETEAHAWAEATIPDAADETVPDRGELARRLLGSGRRFSPDRDAVAELVEERASEEE